MSCCTEHGHTLLGFATCDSDYQRCCLSTTQLRCQAATSQRASSKLQAVSHLAGGGLEEVSAIPTRAPSLPQHGALRTVRERM
eukprot:354461-Chlamydomonas_euryale.AAC.8